MKMDDTIEKLLFLDEAMETEIWENFLVVFDTSALLALYDYTESFRLKFYAEVLDKFKDKLFITGHTEYEFFKNRKAKIRNPITQKIEPFNGKLEELLKIPVKQLKSNIDSVKASTKKDDQVPFLDQDIFDISLNLIDQLQLELNSLTSRIEESLSKQKEDIEKLEKDDSIYPKLKEYFNVGCKLRFEEKIQLINNEGELRFRNKIPPGFKDDPRNNSKSKKEGMQIYGDLYIWKETIKISIENNCNILFITNDLKDDWCIKDEKRNGSIKHPRFDLIAEFRSETNQDFWMYSVSDILYFANKYLDAKFTKDEIEVVEELIEDEGYDPIQDAIDRALFRIIENVKWDIDNKAVIFENELYPGYDTTITNVQDLVAALNEDVTSEAIAEYPLYYIKEFGPFDYEHEVVDYLLTNKKEELTEMGWYDEI